MKITLTFNEIESKYRAIRKKIETMAERFVEEDVTSEDERIAKNRITENEIKKGKLYLVVCVSLLKSEAGNILISHNHKTTKENL